MPIKIFKVRRGSLNVEEVPKDDLSKSMDEAFGLSKIFEEIMDGYDCDKLIFERVKFDT